MRTKLLLTAVILLVFAGSFLAKGLLLPSVGVRDEPPPNGQGRSDDAADARPYRRIVSMAPSITETLFALGLGDRVVGVTRYCQHPPEAAKKTEIGGYHDPNFEAIVALKPDLVILLSGGQQSRSAFDKLRLKTLVVNHRNVDGILRSILTIGRACDAEAKAAEIVADAEARMEQIRRKTAGLPRPRVMVTIERTTGSGKLEDVCIAGRDGFFEEVIPLAGGQNVYRQGNVRFPIVSAEGIMTMNPQVILDMSAGLATATAGGKRRDKQAILADWQQVGEVEAVKTGRVYGIDQDYAFRPGPRFILLVEDLARLIHPEVDWDRRPLR